MLHIFPHKNHIIRMCSVQIILGSDCLFRIKIINRIIKSTEFQTFYIKIPIRHTNRLERKLYLVISFFKFPIQLLDLRNVLPESRIAYYISIFILIERDTHKITILPSLIILGLYATGKIDGDILSSYQGLHCVVKNRPVLGVYNIHILRNGQ